MGSTTRSREKQACTPVLVDPNAFNPACMLPYGLTTEHICRAMTDFVNFLGFINRQLYARKMLRLEAFLMPANFSSIVGEFLNMTIPKHYPRLVKNQYHNGHPDLLPNGMFPNNAAQHAQEGRDQGIALCKRMAGT